MKNIVNRNLSVSPDFNAGLGLSHCIISIKFIDKASVITQLDIFDALKKLGTFRVQDQKKHVYILDFKSEFAKGKMEKRLKELAGPDRLFDYTIEEVRV
ncbi:MAG: hypothetical protein KKH28_12510 [Elusimicrobia bacterium]|nr:hypothetical protein [Elusimicrobiota bacterium]